MKYRYLLPCIFILFLCGPTQAQTASFDCRQAQTDTEWAICNTPELGALDMEMAATYEKLVAHASNDATALQNLRHDQSAWIDGTRDPCSGDVSCLAQVYRARISILENNPPR